MNVFEVTVYLLRRMQLHFPEVLRSLGKKKNSEEGRGWRSPQFLGEQVELSVTGRMRAGLCSQNPVATLALAGNSPNFFSSHCHLRGLDVPTCRQSS